MALELGSHPKPAQIADALVYISGYPGDDRRRDFGGGPNPPLIAITATASLC